MTQGRGMRSRGFALILGWLLAGTAIAAGWSLPDKGEGDSNIQSIMFQEYLDALQEGVQGLNYVVSGGAITGGADMTPAIADVVVVSNGTVRAVTGADVTITTADATNPRLDLVVVNTSGSLAVRAGTAAANPKPPARTANDVLLWVVYVPANDTAIGTSQAVDLRVFRDDIGREYLLRQDSSYTLTSQTAAQQLFNASTNGRITLETGAYEFDIIVALTGMSATSGNATFDLAGTATLGTILWHGIGRDAASDATTGTYAGSYSTDATLTAAPLVTAGTGTTAFFKIEGTFEVTAAGTLQPRILLQTASAAVVTAGSYIKIRKLSGSTSFTTFGRWD
ncbi:MAG TPA: hypothetical protein PLX85_00570 [Dehalococcoidia bacterium]|nr:hypothetical protein [Dehalococcoidia bacterium]